jgi:hypothetical protein
VAGLRRRAAAAAIALASALALAACGGGTNGHALATCHGISQALRDYDRSLHAATPGRRAADLAAARHHVAEVQGDAALANSEDGTYDALMTIVQEAQVLPFGAVAPALRAACRSVTAPSYG